MPKTRPRCVDEDGWLTCVNTIQVKEDIHTGTCNAYGSLIAGTVFGCSTYKRWFHNIFEDATDTDMKEKQ